MLHFLPLFHLILWYLSRHTDWEMGYTSEKVGFNSQQVNNIQHVTKKTHLLIIYVVRVKSTKHKIFRFLTSKVHTVTWITGTALTLNFGANWRWMVISTTQPFYPSEMIRYPFIGGWVGPGPGLNGYGKSRPLPGFDPWICRPVASRYSGPLYSRQRKAIILIHLVLAVRFLGVNHSRCELDHSSSSNVKVKTDWSSTSTLSAFMASKGTNFILDIIITFSRVVHMHSVKFQFFLNACTF